MSKGFIVIDPSGLDPLPAANELMTRIENYVCLGMEKPDVPPSKNISNILRWASEKYGSIVDDASQWTSWPTSLLATGRHCTFNLCPSANSMTFMMILCGKSKQLGLIMIGLSGKNPFITTPGGGGLLD